MVKAASAMIHRLFERSSEGGQMFCRTSLPQFLLHMDLHMEWKSFSSLRTSVVFISSDILANGSQRSHARIMTLCSCASAAARDGSLHTCSPQLGSAFHLNSEQKQQHYSAAFHYFITKLPGFLLAFGVRWQK